MNRVKKHKSEVKFFLQLFGLTLFALFVAYFLGM